MKFSVCFICFVDPPLYLVEWRYCKEHLVLIWVFIWYIIYLFFQYHLSISRGLYASDTMLFIFGKMFWKMRQLCILLTHSLVLKRRWRCKTASSRVTYNLWKINSICMSCCSITIKVSKINENRFYDSKGSISLCKHDQSKRAVNVDWVNFRPLPAMPNQENP